MTDPIATPRADGMANSFDPADPSARTALPPDTAGMIERRARLLGPAYRLFYRTPLQVSRAEGVMLYDRQGRDYLDCYNNVVSVGHANRTVNEAIKAQMDRLCTHTRYLQDEILDFADELLTSFAGDLDHVMFTCSGSEANDLGLRIAMHQTGQKGIIITADAYHGTSHLTAGISPSLGAGAALGDWVRLVPAPDSYRGDAAGMGERMAAAVAAQIHDLRRHGQGLAAFVADQVFSSDGVFSHPAGVLAPVARVVHAAGGVMIADEVQSGFGRSGDALWGYQRHGYVPDIVTMGKPMGNGYPVAALAVRAEVIARFGADLRYFNTFGGNSVAIAAARATLGVIRDQGLVAHAKVTGAALRDGLRALMTRHAAIGDVRGAGLYAGVELVADRTTKAPDARAAAAVVNHLRDNRILISATGPGANVLKIRPPLVFGPAHVARLVDGIDRALTAVGGG